MVLRRGAYRHLSEPVGTAIVARRCLSIRSSAREPHRTPKPNPEKRKKGRTREGREQQKAIKSKQNKKAKNLNPQSIIKKKNDLKRMVEKRGGEEREEKEKRKIAKNKMEALVSMKHARCRFVEGARRGERRMKDAKCAISYTCNLGQCVHVFSYYLCVSYVCASLRHVANYLYALCHTSICVRQHATPSSLLKVLLTNPISGCPCAVISETKDTRTKRETMRKEWGAYPRTRIRSTFVPYCLVVWR